MLTTFLILLFLNGIPAIACLLIGGVQWALTLALLGLIVSASITLAAYGIQQGFGLPDHPFSLAPSADARTLIALSLDVLFLFVLNHLRTRSTRGRAFWLVELHDKLHGK